MTSENCKCCLGMSCPFWPTCFPEMQEYVKELEAKIKRLEKESKSALYRACELLCSEKGKQLLIKAIKDYEQSLKD